MRLRALVLLFPWWIACGSPIVGSECRSGFTRCGGLCVDITSDFAHCGACDNDCGRFECSAGQCGPNLRPDAGGEGDGGALGDAGSDGSTLSGDGGGNPSGQDDGGIGTPFVDGGLVFPDPVVDMSCSIGETDCGQTCSDLQSDLEHCGGCTTMCDADQFCIAGRCEDGCDAPLMRCGPQCLDLQNDDANCGMCGNGCSSGLCIEGACADAIPGHVVVIGHDFSSPARDTMKRIAGNALFLARGSPVRTLVYTGDADEDSVAGVSAAIDAIVELDGRSWRRTAASPDRVAAQLASADAFLIHAQAGAADAALLALGQQWGLSLSQFLLRGGVIVLFETATEENVGTFQILEPSGLFTAESREDIGRQNLTVVTPGLGVATRATRNYAATPVTVRFLDVTSAGAVVVQDADAEAVVVHRVVAAE